MSNVHIVILCSLVFVYVLMCCILVSMYITGNGEEFTNQKNLQFSPYTFFDMLSFPRQGYYLNCRI